MQSSPCLSVDTFSDPWSSRSWATPTVCSVPFRPYRKSWHCRSYLLFTQPLSLSSLPSSSSLVYVSPPPPSTFSPCPTCSSLPPSPINSETPQGEGCGSGRWVPRLLYPTGFTFSVLFFCQLVPDSSLRGLIRGCWNIVLGAHKSLMCSFWQ